MALADLYTSIPLLPGSRSIRVLEIEKPWDCDPQSPINGNLRIIKLDDQPRFTALSYVWGTFTSPPETISIGNHAVPVSSNCWSALSHLRAHFGAITIWIDAICINQDDTKEKEDQLPLMGDIYSLAATVYIWLGEGTPESDQAIDYLSVAGFQTYLPATEELDPVVHCGQTTCWRLAMKILFKNGLELTRHLRTHGTRDLSKGLSQKWTFSLPDSWVSHVILDDFFSRIWTSRVWTLQEFLLARNPVICCGTKTLPWKYLARSLLFMELSSTNFSIQISEATTFKWVGLALIWFSLRQPDSWREQTSLTTGLPAYAAFINRIMAHYRRIYWSILVTFLGILVGSTAMAFVIEPNSMEVKAFRFIPAVTVLVFAGLSFSIPFSFGKSDQLQMEGRINAVEAIIQEIRTRKATNPKDKSYGVHAILQTLGLSLTAPDYSRDLGEIHKELFLKLLSWTKSLNLLLCANGPREDGQPSWVPDWRLDSDKMWLKPSQLFGRARNNATPDSDPWWSNRDENKLVVRGRKINHVDWCGRPFQPVSETYDENERAAHIHNITLTRDQYRAHLVRTNPGATFGDTCLRRSHYLDTKDDPSHVFLAEEHLWWTWDRIIQRVDTMTPSDVVERMLSIPRLMEFHASLCNGLANKSRTVFVTAPHPLAVGNCPVGTQVGDVIALVSGVPMPLVLREVAESGDYQLIGFAVVEAMTRGLAWKDAHEDDLEEIVLC